MSRAKGRILPRPDLDTIPHFQAAAEGRLSVPFCGSCGTFHWYPTSRCPACGSSAITWPTLSGAGRILTYTTVENPLMPWLAERIPYVLAVIELKDAPGVRLVTDVVNSHPADVRMGDPVRAVFETLSKDLGIVHFEVDTTLK